MTPLITDNGRGRPFYNAFTVTPKRRHVTLSSVPWYPYHSIHLLGRTGSIEHRCQVLIISQFADLTNVFGVRQTRAEEAR